MVAVRGLPTRAQLLAAEIGQTVEPHGRTTLVYGDSRGAWAQRTLLVERPDSMIEDQLSVVRTGLADRDVQIIAQPLDGGRALAVRVVGTDPGQVENLARSVQEELVSVGAGVRAEGVSRVTIRDVARETAGEQTYAAAAQRARELLGESDLGGVPGAWPTTRGGAAAIGRTPGGAAAGLAGGPVPAAGAAASLLGRGTGASGAGRALFGGQPPGQLARAFLSRAAGAVSGREPAQSFAPLALSQSGGALVGGATTALATDEQDPNRWTKVLRGAGLGALLGGTTAGYTAARALTGNTPAAAAAATSRASGVSGWGARSLDLDALAQLRREQRAAAAPQPPLPGVPRLPRLFNPLMP